MRRDPVITFRGALRLLGHHERPWLDRLDRALSGVILGAGPLPGGIAALWGWVDQKNEATRLLRAAMDRLDDRLSRTGGLERHELVAAAHTTIVLTAYFDAFRLHMGDLHREAAITDREKLHLLARADVRELQSSMVRALYLSPVPAPSAAVGFEENAHRVAAWAFTSTHLVMDFVSGLDVPLPTRAPHDAIATSTADRYKTHFLDLAAKVPEFAIWADLREHAATRRALAGLSELLAVHVARTTVPDLRATVRDVNLGELGRPVIDAHTDGYGVEAVFPTVEEVFLDPAYRMAAAQEGARFGEEGWWARRPVAQDLDRVLARHFSAPDSTRLPMLLLGHPGAGKSLLTKVLAARLPESTYVVVRVPLRHVDANTVIAEQVQQALDRSTHSRVRWPALVEQSKDAIRVVLLDGLDELLQATSHDRVGYLREVAEFQRIEAELGRPVAVLVTSRTLVVDRVDVPTGTPVVKLEEFDDERIRAWLAVWNRVNAGTGARPVPPEVAFGRIELARQPLLLLMLALYCADPQMPPPDRDMSLSELYARLFDTFARREATKKAGRPLRGEELEAAAHDQVRRLSVAAAGMFNRGRQDITEADLGADLRGLGEPSPSGERLLGEFFFVHAAEARERSVRRSYEFLHATFGEFLVADRVVETLLDVAEGAYGRRRVHEPDDELLHALLSHQPLAVQRPALDFVHQRFRALEPLELERVVRVLKALVPAYRARRSSGRYDGYRPTRPDVVRELAAYSANLVLLLIEAHPAGVSPDELWPGTDAPREWRSMVALWQAGLDVQGYRAVLDAIEHRDGVLRGNTLPRLSGFDELQRARLRGDWPLEQRLRLGHAYYDGLSYLVVDKKVKPSAEWHDSMMTWISAAMLLPKHHVPHVALVPPPPDTPDDVVRLVADMAYEVLLKKCGDWSEAFTVEYVGWLLHLVGGRDELPLAVATHLHPRLAQQYLELAVNELREPSGAVRLLRMATTGKARLDGEVASQLKAFVKAFASTPDQPLVPRGRVRRSWVADWPDPVVASRVDDPE